MLLLSIKTRSDLTVWGRKALDCEKETCTLGFYRHRSDPRQSFPSCTVFLSQSPLRLSIHISRNRIGFTIPMLGQITGPENKASCLFPGSEVLVESSSCSWVSLASVSGCKTVGGKQFPSDPGGNYFQAWKPEICPHSVPFFYLNSYKLLRPCLKSNNFEINDVF